MVVLEWPTLSNLPRMAQFLVHLRGELNGVATALDGLGVAEKPTLPEATC